MKALLTISAKKELPRTLIGKVDFKALELESQKGNDP